MRIIPAAIVAALLCAGAPADQVSWGQVTLESPDIRLVSGFDWARKQALAYVFTGDPVGPWYEAALPGRSAFCMRDVSHQSTGANVLGLQAVNRNMLWRFAQAVSASKDWCSFWEIDKWNRPAPIDYISDRDFWYNLPANFDLLRACYRQYLWTGDRTYIDSEDFRNFYERTVHDYVRAWDKDHDGIPESYARYGRRGLGTYNEELGKHRKVGSDLVAAQHASFLAYAAMADLRGQRAVAAEFRNKASGIRKDFHYRWWSESEGRAYSSILEDGSYDITRVCGCFPLWFGIYGAGPRLERSLDQLLGEPPINVEELSYLPEIAYRYGRNVRAYDLLLTLTDPNLKRRDYPEVSFAAIGAVASGLMGIEPDAARGVVKTFPRLTAQTASAKLSRVPVLSNEIAVAHVGTGETTFSNLSGAPLRWHAAFPGKAAILLVDSRPVAALAEQSPSGSWESYVRVEVPAGASRTVRIANPSFSR